MQKAQHEDNWLAVPPAVAAKVKANLELLWKKRKIDLAPSIPF
jgi:hypothetical protein